MALENLTYYSQFRSQPVECLCVYMAKLAYTLVGTDSKRSRETGRGTAVSWLRDMIHTPRGHQCPVDAAQQYKGAISLFFSQIILVYSHYFCIVVLLLHISSRHSFHASRQNHQIIKDERLGPLQLLQKKYQHLAACYLICMQLPFCSSISRASRSQKQRQEQRLPGEKRAHKVHWTGRGREARQSQMDRKQTIASLLVTIMALNTVGIHTSVTHHTVLFLHFIRVIPENRSYCCLSRVSTEI